MGVPPGAATLVDGAPLMAHLATSHDDRPHVAPVWYGYDDGVLRVLTSGRKLANLRANPRVAVSIQHDEDGDARWFVAFQGTAQVIEDAGRVRAAVREVYSKYLGADPDAWPAEYRRQLDAPDHPLVEIDIGSATFREY